MGMHRKKYSLVTITVRNLDENNATVDKVTKKSVENSNKIAFIHIVSSTKTIAMAPLRKVTVLRNSAPRDGIVSKDKKSAHSAALKPEVFHQRKRMLMENKELFQALMRLPDKEMQRKLLNVINNHHSTERKTVGTQTDPIEFKSLSITEKSGKVCSDGSTENDVLNHSNGGESDTLNVKDIPISVEILKKKKRKRKVSLPQANKESRSKHLTKVNKPKSCTVSSTSTTVTKVELQRLKSPKRPRFNSFCMSECSSDVVNIYEDSEANHIEEIEQSSFPLENGLLPIQDAVIRNQTNKLNMHILIWQSYKRVDINHILTEEDEDLLQLAVLNTCDPSIVNLLLKKGLNPNSLDADSNTVIHLAILNDITVASFDHLMQYIDLKLLLTLNDDGYTALHMAVRLDRYLLTERLINILDERLVTKFFYKCPLDELETDEFVLKKQFKDYYEEVCHQMAVDEETDLYTVDNHDLKQKLLQTGDRRSGSSALYFAIDLRFEHLIYFLLAHLTDPRTENFSGIDCKSYFSEFGKSLNLSLNIDNTMEKVVKLLS